MDNDIILEEPIEKENSCKDGEEESLKSLEDEGSSESAE